MATYSNFNDKNVYGQSVTNYTSRDFASIKQSLITHVKSYFPQVYKDFNETSPGMMLIEMSAYVGDVLNYYIDDSFKELMLPLSEDRRNIINLSKMTGYKARPIVPSFTDLTFTLTVDADTSSLTNIRPNESQKLVIQKGTQVTAESNSEIVFETLDPIDFTTDLGEGDFVFGDVDSTTGLISSFKATRVVRAVSGETKSVTYEIGAAEQFKRITLPGNNIIEVLDVTDSNGNTWYEVDYLAQENVAISKYFTETGRDSGLETSDDGSTNVPSSLSFVRSTKRFITETNDDNSTSMIFGNGVLKNGERFETTFLNLEQEGVNLPTTKFSPRPLDAKSGQYYESLGEAPQNISLTINYRAGGGLNSNLPVGDLTAISSITTIPAGESVANLSVNNEVPATGGKEGDFTEEIRQGALSNYSTQQRCVTKEDFEARVITLPPKFGSVAKVFCSSGGTLETYDNTSNIEHIQTIIKRVLTQILNGAESIPITELSAINLLDGELVSVLSADGENITKLDTENAMSVVESLKQFASNTSFNPTVDIFVLSYDVNGKLIHSPELIKRNIKNYLKEFRLVTDKIRILNGYVINFGILFDVMKFPGFDSSVIKNKCIEAVKKLYTTSNMQFKQTLYTADVINVLNTIEGVKAVNDVIFTQDKNFTTDETIFNNPLYSKSINEDGDIIKTNELGYGHLYDFSQFFQLYSPEGRGVVLSSMDPAVFEIKNLDTDIRGVIK